MIRAIYLAECDTCGLMSAIPQAHAENLIRQCDAEVGEGEPVTVSRCAVMTEGDGGPENCAGDVILVGIVAMTQLPTAEQIYKESLR